MNKSLLVCWFCVLIFSANSLIGQSKIKTARVLADTSSFHFTSEWQYLSTDIYLFNGNKFNNLINELDFTREQKGGFLNFKKERNEFLEYLFITASLKNVRFFDDREITYPLYNFRVNKEQENQYRTYISEDIDHIRIIDNLPLYATSDYIDAEIEVHAITNNQRDQVLGLVANQLKNISQIANPSTAVLALVGELGNFMESSSRKKEYHFSSTIRLYEKKDFDSRLHSIIVYALKTDNSTDFKIPGDSLAQFMEDPTNRKIDRETIRSLIPFKEYPYLVVANYKSLYKMDAVTGDEITVASIERRKLKIENDFQDGLISEDTYMQEKDFVNFLKIFANLKKALEMYSLNFKTGNNEAISNSLFTIVKEYHQLLQTYKHLSYKYENNHTFHQIFQSEYESILGYAQIYLEKDHYLNNARYLVETTMQVDTMQINSLDSLEYEQLLADLHVSDLFKNESLKSTTLGKSILNQIAKIEKIHYNRYFEEDIIAVKNLAEYVETPGIVEKLGRASKATHCALCSDSSMKAIKSYFEEQKKYRKQELLKELDSIRNVCEGNLITYLNQLNDVEYNLSFYFRDDTTSKVFDIINSKYLKARRDAGNLSDLLSRDKKWLADLELELLRNYQDKLEEYDQSIADKLKFICQYDEKLCYRKSKTREIENSLNRKKSQKQYQLARHTLNKKIQNYQSVIDQFRDSLTDSEHSDTSQTDVYHQLLNDIESGIHTLHEHLHKEEPIKDSEYKEALKSINSLEEKLEQKLASYCFTFPAFCLKFENYLNAE